MKLTAKQVRFCSEFVKLGNATQAYKNTFNTSKMKPRTIIDKASILKRSKHIRATIAELQAEVLDDGILTAREIQKLLSDRIKQELDGDGLKATDILNKMCGNYVVEQAKDTVKLEIEVL